MMQFHYNINIHIKPNTHLTSDVKLTLLTNAQNHIATLAMILKEVNNQTIAEDIHFYSHALSIKSNYEE